MPTTDRPTALTQPEPRCLYCDDTELEHGIDICWGKDRTCWCTKYRSREHLHEEKEASW